jgi:hypothetical protein
MDKRRFKLLHFAYHAHELGDWDSLFAAIDREQHLLARADLFQDFRGSAEDLTTHALVGALERTDWCRFIHYALLAVNLQGLADALADEEILSALARHGMVDLARHLAAQLLDPGRRAAARAAIVSLLDGAARDDLFRQVREDLRLLPHSPAEGEIESVLTTLLAVARHFGAALGADWPALADRLAVRPELADRLWLAVATSCREEGGSAHPGVLPALGQVRDTALLADSLLAWFRERGSTTDVKELLAQLSGAGEGLRWLILLTVLSREAAADVTGAWEAWQRERANGNSVPWSHALVEAAAGLLGRLDATQAAVVASELPDLSVRAAFHVIRLEWNADLTGAVEALAAVRAIADPAAQLHWGLRLVSAWPAADVRTSRRLTAAAIAHLMDRRYAVPARDLRQYLDLVAKVFPGELRREVMSAFYAPYTGDHAPFWAAGADQPVEPKAATLLVLADGAESEPLCEILFDRAETLAAAAAPTPAAGFELRVEFLLRLARNRCLAERSLDALERAATRLLPDEEDTLRAALARAFASVVEPAPAADTGARWLGLARAAAARIRAPRLKLVTRLAIAAREEVLGATPKPLALDALYEAVASVEGAEDESLALAVLVEPPLDLRGLMTRSLAPMRDRERLVQALVDLAHHAIAFEEGFYRRRQRDPLGPLQLVRQSLRGVGSDERLLGLAVELAALVSPLATSRALPELHETAEIILLQLEEVPWQRRREALERLLALIGPVLLRDLDRMGRKEAIERCRSAAVLLDAILTLPEKARQGPNREELRHHWHEVLPLVVSTLECLPAAVAGFLTHPLHFWLWRHWPACLGRPHDWQTAREGLARLEGVLMPRHLARRLATAWSDGGERFTARWSWMTAEQGVVLRLCRGSAAERRARALALLAAPDSRAAGEVAALAFLLAGEVPDLALNLVTDQPPGADRDALCLRLLRGGWIRPPDSDRLEAAIGERATLLAARLHRPDLADEEWTRTLGEMVVHHGLDPGDPRAWPLLRRLREQATKEDLAALAASTIEALRQKGRLIGERSFNVWLNAFVPPRGGEPAQAAPVRCVQARAAIRRALSLRRAREPSPPEGGEHRRLTGVHERWLNANGQPQSRASWLSANGLRSMFAVLVATLSLTLLPLDGSLWAPTRATPDPGPSLPPPSGAWLAAAALLVVSLNILGIESFLRWESTGERGWRRSLLVLRAAAAGLPVVGLATIPAWRWLVRHPPARLLAGSAGQRPSWLDRTASSRLAGTAARTTFSSGLFRLALGFTSQWGAAGWLIANWCLALLASSWLASVLPSAEGRGPIVAIDLVWHLVILAGGIASIWTEARQAHRTAPQSLSSVAPLVLVLVPFPPFAVVGAFWAVLASPDRQRVSIVAAFLAARGSTDQLRPWLRLEEQLRILWRRGAWWRRWRQRPRALEKARDSLAAEQELANLYRVKSAALAVDGALLAWASIRWVGATKIAPQLGCVTVGALCLAACGVAAVGLRLVQRLLHTGSRLAFPDEHGYARHLAAGQLALVAGLVLGNACHRGDGMQVANVLVAVGLGGTILCFLATFAPWPRSTADGHRNLMQTLAFGLTAATGLVMPADFCLRTVELYGLAAFASLPLYMAAHLDALLRPFSAWQALAPGRPARTRLLLGFLAATAILPLGGLAVPAWVLVRHRLWPRLVAAEAARRLTPASSPPAPGGELP